MGMKNKHLEHPEDSIFTQGREGLYNILNFLSEKKSRVSVKYDGCPAIVWGINPDNNRFFVGTKSVFNKVKVKINYNHNDIEVNHGHVPAVASILHMCLDNLPRIRGVYQCDFIGYGGAKEYNPNTITYRFNPPISDRHNIVVAAHTHYIGHTLKDMEAVFEFPFSVNTDECDQNRAKTDPFSQEKTKFLNTSADLNTPSSLLGLYITAARIAARFIKFPNENQGKKLKIAVNKYIREGRKLDASLLAKETGFNKNIFQLYNLLIEIKEMLMETIESYEYVDCFIQGEECGHEGYVMTNEYGTFKLVDREQFSYANFNLNKKWNK